MGIIRFFGNLLARLDSTSGHLLGAVDNVAAAAEEASRVLLIRTQKQTKIQLQELEAE